MGQNWELSGQPASSAGTFMPIRQGGEQYSLNSSPEQGLTTGKSLCNMRILGAHPTVARAWRQETLQGVYGVFCKCKLCRDWALLLALLSLLSTAAGESNPCIGDNTFPHLYLNPKRQQNMEHARGTAV